MLCFISMLFVVLINLFDIWGVLDLEEQKKNGNKLLAAIKQTPRFFFRIVLILVLFIIIALVEIVKRQLNSAEGS